MEKPNTKKSEIPKILYLCAKLIALRYLDPKNEVVFKKIFGQHPGLEKKEFWKMLFGLRFGFFETTRKDWQSRIFDFVG